MIENPDAIDLKFENMDIVHPSKNLEWQYVPSMFRNRYMHFESQQEAD